MNPVLKWLALNDFSPGIIQRLGQSRTGAGPAPLGAAAATGTYRCYALPGGGLAPLPRRTYTLDRPATHPYPVNFTVATNMGLKVLPMATGGASTFGIRDIRDTTLHAARVFIGHEFVSPTGQQIGVGLYNLNAALSGTNPTIYGLTTTDLTVTNIFSPVYIASTRMTATGSPLRPTVVASALKANTSGTPDGFSIAQPDPVDPTAVNTFAFAAATRGIVLGHQGRALFLKRKNYLVGPVAAHRMEVNDLMDWTLVDSTTLDATDVCYSPENSVGVGAWGSVSASDLILIKHSGGGVLVQGDLNNPIIRRFPAMTGTNGSECVGAFSPLGFVYGVNRGGVYLWGGGDSSELISPQLDNDFWINDTPNFGSKESNVFKGQFATAQGWLICPNNWIFDPTTKAWFRLEDPTLHSFFLYDVDPITGFIYAARMMWENDLTILYGFDPSMGAESYRWTSQPIILTDSHETSVDELVLTAQGNGTVTVTIGGTVLAFTIASPTAPVRIRKTLGKSLDTLVIQIDSVETTGGTVGAPIVYDLRLGMKEERGLTNA